MVKSEEKSADFSLNGNFSEDVIQHFLGVMNDPSQNAAQLAADNNHHQANHHQANHHQEEATTNTSHNVPNSGMSPAEIIANPAAAETTATTPSLPRRLSTNSSCNNSIGGGELDEASKALARSERKRSREKQRRTDVNKQFTDLTKIVRKIEQEEREEDPNVFRQPFSSTNRADLVARTIAHIERLRDSNKRRRDQCVLLQQTTDSYKAALHKSQEEKHQQNEQVMMMVPMMMPSNTSQSMPQFGGMQTPSTSAMNQYMMPMMHQQPSVATTATTAAASQIPHQQQTQAPVPTYKQAPAQVPHQQQQQPQQSPHQQQQAQALSQQQMMLSSMQSLFPNMVDPIATNAAMAVAPLAAPAHTATQATQQQPMSFLNFQDMTAVAHPTAQSNNNDTTTGGEEAQAQHYSNGNSGGGSNYVHCP